MSLSIKGKLTKKLDVESGVSKAGKEWKKQSFIIDTGSQYNSEICFQLFGEEKIDILNNHNEGDEILVSFNLSSREYNGKYFHNIDAWRIEKNDTNNSEINSAPKFEGADAEDDLPF